MEQSRKKGYTKQITVTQEMLACAVKSGSLRVLATPVAAALAENAACTLAQEYVDEGCTTVGTDIHLAHLSPTPAGVKVWAEAELLKHQGREFPFSVTVFDEGGAVAKGTHTRFSVKADSFQQKADGKLRKAPAENNKGQGGAQ